MSEDQNVNSAQPDAFEAALAASATDLATPHVEEVVEEVLQVKLSERATRLMDGENEESMEKKKTEGYF